MRIGIIIGSLGFGGAERVSVSLAEWWLKRGHQVDFFTTKTPPKSEYSLHREIGRYDCHVDKGNMKLILSLRSIVKMKHPDVVLIMDTPMCVYAVPALLGLDIPFVVSERSAPNRAAVKTETRILSRLFMCFADAFIFQTNGAKSYFPAMIQKRGFVIPNPLSVDKLPAPCKGIREKKVVAVGRLITAKNYPLLIDAFILFANDHADYLLEIYGEGPERSFLEEYIRMRNAQDIVTLKGSYSNVLSKIYNAQMYVLSSDLEGMPNALIEAMAIGIPSIATDCPSGGPAYLIQDGVNGLLVPTGNSKALAEAMTMLARDDSLNNKLSTNGQNVRKILDIDKIGAEWEIVLSTTVTSR